MATTGTPTKRLGFAKRVRVRLPFGASRRAWDCRPFGAGRIVAPSLATAVEIAHATWLDLKSGEVRVADVAARAA
ncbi:MAG TPA: hypothetical protein VFD92_11425 [Candidatus Binatia bacterium]|nr:hypothetical protein [Candidatus Binatia bacterium]